MARYFVHVPIKWPVGSNTFKVEVEAADEMTSESLKRIQKLAVEDVKARGLEVLDEEPKVFRKK